MFLQHPRWDVKSRGHWKTAVKLVKAHLEKEEDKRIEQLERRIWVENCKKRARERAAERQRQEREQLRGRGRGRWPWAWLGWAGLALAALVWC